MGATNRARGVLIEATGTGRKRPHDANTLRRAFPWRSRPRLAHRGTRRRASCTDAGDADRGSKRVLRERGDIGSVEYGAPAVVELAGFPAGEGLSRRRLEVGRHSARPISSRPSWAQGELPDQPAPLCPLPAVFWRSFSGDDGLPRDRPPSRPSAAGAARTGPTSRRPPRPCSGPPGPTPPQ